MNLQKQIKRHVISRRHEFFAVVTPGFEELCGRELGTLTQNARETGGLQVQRMLEGGLEFSGRLIDLYRANLHLRTAGRILWRLARFKATNVLQLTHRIQKISWSWLLPAGCLPEVRAVSHRSRLYHSQAVAESVQAGVAAFWSSQGIAAAADPGQTLAVRLEQDVATVSLDSSGANLYMRGFKHHSAAAPLRETMAAGILMRAGYEPAMPLLDPMCGAGTFSLEAAMIAKGVAPGSRRNFAFMQWPAFSPRQWLYLKREAETAVRQCAQPTIHASDVDPEACRELDECLHRNRLDDAARVSCQDFFDLRAPGPGGLIVLNPPYGRRLTPAGDPALFYRRLRSVLTERFKGWRLAMLLPEDDRVRHWPSLHHVPLVHGGLKVRLAVGRI